VEVFNTCVSVNNFHVNDCDACFIILAWMVKEKLCKVKAVKNAHKLRDMMRNFMLDVPTTKSEIPHMFLSSIL
jgi:hypothetical protein